MNVKLKQLRLTNFKGLKSFTIDFDSNITSILGQNGTGKTTLFDAFTWLLFGKDHNENTSFEIKTLNKNNVSTPKLEHSVEAVISVDDEIVKIKRTFTEKWVKKRGATEAELTGHETSFHWNDVPLKLKEWNEKIAGLTDEAVFKMVTNPLAFNALKWQDRRNILTEITADLTRHLQSATQEQFRSLLDKLTNKTIEEYRKEISAKKRILKEDLEQIPIKIAQTQKMMPEEANWASLNSQLDVQKAIIEDIETQLEDNASIGRKHLALIQDKQDSLLNLNKKIAGFETEANNTFSATLRKKDEAVNTAKRLVQNAENKLNEIEQKLQFANKHLDDNTAKMQQLREDFIMIQQEQIKFDNNAFCCPTCKRDFEQSDIEAKKEELIANFNLNKANRLKAINKSGLELKNENNSITEDIARLNTEKEQAIEACNVAKEEAQKTEQTPPGVQTTQSILSQNEDYNTTKRAYANTLAEVQELEEKTPRANEMLISKLKIKKADTTQKIDKLKEELAMKKQIEKAKIEIAELEQQQATTAQLLANVEKEEFTITEYIAQNIANTEKAVNSLFPSVKVKMFEKQINGGTKEICDMLINGVPFNGANNAAKIQAGIEIINVLSQHYNFHAPIFVDNAESVLTLPSTPSQLIRLVVSEAHTSLTITQWQHKINKSKK